MARQTKAEKQEIAEYTERLRRWLPPGSTVHTIVTHVAKSGMSRRIRLFALVTENGQTEITDISFYVGRVLGYRRHDRDGGLIVGGCGMDMCFHLVHCLSYALHGRADVGADAIASGSAGRPFTPTAKQYRSGYSLVKQDL